MAGEAHDFRTDVPQDWCPGCGDYGILAAAQSALKEMAIPFQRLAVFSGIGCHGKIAHFLNLSGVHTLHGRSLPFAVGAKLANPSLEVLCFAGDGDGLGIGVGHFVHAGRRNVDLTYVIHDNGVYGLTKGQASPTLSLGTQTKSLPQPNINAAVNPLALALTSGATFVARSYAFDLRHLKEMLKRAVAHRGFSVLDVLQPCPTYNDVNTRAWYSGEDRKDLTTQRPIPRVRRLDGAAWDPVVPENASPEFANRKLLAALEKVTDPGEDLPIGIFFENRAIAPYTDRIARRIPFYGAVPPAAQPIRDARGAPLPDLAPLLDSLRV
ncbi:MAG: 2-oxoacid:ferredoxin oxidoreductase subunit beta [Euryarchaeota archaeon]|nr:2-oxoacid:ferredoxin oxidoreductase subunit beta [Euryarchaeota archaeon]